MKEMPLHSQYKAFIAFQKGLQTEFHKKRIFFTE